jgi:hypothetical protein
MAHVHHMRKYTLHNMRHAQVKPQSSKPDAIRKVHLVALHKSRGALGICKSENTMAGSNQHRGRKQGVEFQDRGAPAEWQHGQHTWRHPDVVHLHISMSGLDTTAYAVINVTHIYIANGWKAEVMHRKGAT